jgi:hypothetical protein
MHADTRRYPCADTENASGCGKTLAGESACPTVTRRLCAGICRKTQDLDPPGRLTYDQGEQIWKTRIAVPGSARRIPVTAA